MPFSKIKRLFRSRLSSDDGISISMIWVVGDEEATLIDPDSGRVHAYVWHDGYGKFYPTVIVSPWRAFRLLCRHDGFVVSLLSLPRVTVEMVRVKAASIGMAQQDAEYGLGLND